MEDEILPSALKRSSRPKRRISREDIRHALERQICIPFMWESQSYEATLMHIGPKQDGTLIEVGRGEGSDGNWRVVHADIARDKLLRHIGWKV